eukprot:5305657-Amphidinium_carterae.2
MGNQKKVRSKSDESGRTTQNSSPAQHVEPLQTYVTQQTPGGGKDIKAVSPWTQIRLMDSYATRARKAKATQRTHHGNGKGIGFKEQS